MSETARHHLQTVTYFRNTIPTVSDWNEKVENWRERLNEHSSERQDQFSTRSGIDVDAVYGPDRNREVSYSEDIGFPGEPPFTRGVYPNMYRGRFWTMRQYSGFGSGRETNERFHELLDQGQTGLSMAFDLPTQMGLDADDDLARGEVGRAGVSISTLDDMRTVFREIDLSEVSTSMTINATAPVLLSMYCLLARDQDVELNQLRGTVQNDILKEYIARGTYIYPPEASMRLVVDVMEYCREYLPRWNSISVSGYHMREKGATAPQEIAFTLSNALEYLDRAEQRGLAPEAIARQMSFFFSASSDFFEEIAKFRAARRMWSRLLRDEFSIDDPKARRLRFHTQTAGVSLTAQQPENNLVRVAFQALSAVLGGTQSLHTNAMDEALGIPTERTATLALRTQQILAEETGTADTVDPLAGSYFVEDLTDELEEKAMDIYASVQDMGGSLQAVKQGYIRNEIEKEARKKQQAVESGERRVVGVNCYRDEDEDAQEEPDVQSLDPEVIEEQKTSVREYRKQRSDPDVQEALGQLQKAADQPDQNLMPRMMKALSDGATLGEISDTLRNVFGQHTP